MVNDGLHNAFNQLDFAAIRRPLDQSGHTPGFIYFSPEIFDLEKAQIFSKEWLCVGRTEEIANPGDYMALRIVDEPILLTRNKEGQIGCFANLCAHRGVEVAAGSGNTKYLSCPYHAWTYDLNGQLVGASFMQKSRDFETRTFRLKPIHVGEWAGWIFVNFDEEPHPLESHLAEFSADVGYLRMEDCRIGSKLVVDLEANWKFVVENLMDIYHARTLHIKSFGKHRGSPEKYPFYLRKNGGTCTTYEAAPMTPDGKTLFRRMPAIKDRADNFATSCHLAPNMQVIARSDNIHPLVMWPTSPTTSRTIIYNLFPKELTEEPNFRERVQVYDDYLHLVLTEDAVMMQSLQKAMKSSNFEPGRLSIHEMGIHHVLNDYLERLFGPG